MQDCLSSSDISNEMSMMRSAFGGTFLVVEGSSDSRLYTKFIDADKVKIIIAHSKNNVIDSVNECKNKRKDKLMLGFVDSDMDPMLGKRRSPPIFPTDKRDMESTILSSPAIKDVLAEYGDREKIVDFEKKYGPIQDVIAKAASPLGYLMYVSYRKGMNLSFKNIDHTMFVNPRTLWNDIPKMVATIYGISMAQRYPRGAITDLVRDAMDKNGPSWNIARGHDAVAIFKLGLRNSFGSYNSRNITDGELGGALRLAYSKEEFGKSNLYLSSKEWCAKNNIFLWRT